MLCRDIDIFCSMQDICHNDQVVGFSLIPL